MKQALTLMLMMCYCNFLRAQDTSSVKPPSIGLHFFYNDFATAQRIKATSFSDVISNRQWNQPRNMQGGFGLDYLQGILPNIDAIGTFNASWVDYLSPSNVLFGSSHFLLDVAAGFHVKMLTDRKIFSPFLIVKAGYSSYESINGFSFLPGAGLQINLCNEALILSTIEYRTALSSNLSNQFYYSIGIAANIKKPKLKKANDTTAKAAATPVKEEPKTIAKDIVVTVSDEATGQPLQYVEVSLKSLDGIVLNAITNEDGKATFPAIAAGGYTLTGRLNKIDASTASLAKADFSGKGNQLPVALTHNDPRFTLVGNTVDKSAGKPVGNTLVTVTNSTQSSTAFATSSEVDGEFRSQLEAGSDFVIVGKKASYISNIERLSTKELNRSATLYVKLQLGIEEATAGKSIVLNKIYFESGKSVLNTNTSNDLYRLVQFLHDNPALSVEIQGHTDDIGSLAANVRLSRERAASVVRYLVKNGIPKARLLPKGYGPDQPIASNATAEGRAKNRRVEMKVTDL